ncbi:hypothetical protein ACJJTC_019267 [Scirpophaga incertulas]
MLDTNSKFENMLSESPTTYAAGFYRPPIVGPVSKAQHKPRPALPKLAPHLLKDTHTLTEWKSQGTPFHLLHRPRPIIGTHPRAIQKKFEKLTVSEEEHNRVLKSRPRLVMPPAVSMDDIADKHARELLCRDMYTSDATHHQRQAMTNILSHSVRAPLPQHPAHANPVSLPKLHPPYVPPEWRMESVRWDQKQLRAHCDPTEEFWKKYKPYT